MSARGGGGPPSPRLPGFEEHRAWVEAEARAILRKRGLPAEGFLAEMLAIFPVLGVSAFDRPAVREVAGIRYRLSGPDASGEGEDRNDGFLVFAGATARIEETASLSEPFSRLRRRLVETGVFVEDGGLYRLVEDHLFNSPSTAAMALLSRNANGRTEWKDFAGVTLKEHQTTAASGGVS